MTNKPYESAPIRVAKVAMQLVAMLESLDISLFDQGDALRIAAGLIEQQIARELRQKP